MEKVLSLVRLSGQHLIRRKEQAERGGPWERGRQKKMNQEASVEALVGNTVSILRNSNTLTGNSPLVNEPFP
jgi:hypothetical protein